MLAYVLHRYGAADNAKLEDVAAPVPAPNDVLVKVRAAGLNPVDFKFREGNLKVIYNPKMPFVMGNELAGEVIAVGSAVKNFRAGDRVFARTEKGGGGAFAEQACVHEKNLALMPSNIDFVTAAAVPLAGLTALQALRDELHIKAGQSVLISGGAGGVGTFAIQIAKWLGAHVTTTASKRGEALVRSLGCDQVIDYTTQDIAQSPRKFDAAFDLIGGETLDKTFDVMKPGTTVVSVAALPEPVTAMKDLEGRRFLAFLFWIVSAKLRARARRVGVRYRFLFMHPSGAELSELGQLIESGKLKVILDKTFAFKQIADAMAYLESGRAKGKVVVSMDA